VNSKISFDVTDVFGMNEYSLMSFFVIAVLLSSYFLFTFTLLKTVSENEEEKFFSKRMLIPLVAFGIIYFLFRQHEQSISGMLLLILFSGSIVWVSVLNIHKKIRL